MIVVAGATGTLGPLLVPLLVARGEPVRVVTRDPERARRFDGVEVVGADVCTPEGAREAVAGARVVISAMTGFASPAGVRAVDERGNEILASAAADAGVERFILVSVAQAAPDHPIELFRAKAAAEAAVRASGIAWTIVRPTAYLETWLGIVGGPLIASGKALIFGRGRNPINFVSAVDVARTIEHAVAAPMAARQTIEVPGPQNLTLFDLVDIVGAVTGRSGSSRQIPRGMLRLLSVVLRPVNNMRAQQIAAALVMDTREMAVDGPAIRASDPSIDMTTATEVATVLFGAARSDVAASGSSNPGAAAS